MIKWDRLVQQSCSLGVVWRQGSDEFVVPATVDDLEQAGFVPIKELDDLKRTYDKDALARDTLRKERDARGERDAMRVKRDAAIWAITFRRVAPALAGGEVAS